MTIEHSPFYKSIAGIESDEENLIQDIKLEEETIEVYRKHIKLTNRKHIKKLLEHIIKEEEHHSKELRKQLKDINEPLNKKDMKED